jgi:ADP-ribose pyrophosphatase YjhB (NUDIX family)
MGVRPGEGGTEAVTENADIIGAGSKFLPHDEYAFIRDRVPIVCIDLLLSPADDPGRVGLIYRTTGENWCVVGGRVLKNERLSDAVLRHVRSTLGGGITVDLSTLQLVTVFEYFQEPGSEFHDPAKHSVGLTYVATCSGSAEPAGEAAKFQWFTVDELAALDYGFNNQGAVVEYLLQATGRLPG